MASLPTEKLPDELDSTKLGDVINVLWELKHLWKEIGDNLVLTPSQIESIRQREQNDPNSCLREVLKLWLLRASTPNRPISWSAIILALKKNNVRSESATVIQEIFEKYEVVLPKEAIPVTRSSNRVPTTRTETGRKASNQAIPVTQSSNRVPTTRTETGRKASNQGKAKAPGTKITGDKQEKEVTGSAFADVQPIHEQEIEDGNLFRCQTLDLEENGPFSSRNDVQFGSLRIPNIWKGREKLTVKFMNPDVCRGCGFNIDNIMSWANTWYIQAGKEIIPEFVENKEPHTDSDIRVEFSTTQHSHSEVGIRAEDITDAEKPTMVLNLSKGGNNYKKHIVVHEFGHALGLEHEHQRSDFWQLISDHVCQDKIIKNPSFAGRYDCIPHDEDTVYSAQYDLKSVMHYPDLKDYLKYTTIEEVDEAKREQKLSEEIVDVLKGLIKLDLHNLPIYPSTTDIDFLKKLYAPPGWKPEIADPISESTGAEGPEPGDALFNETNVYDKLINYAHKWEDIGRCLGFTRDELKNIRDKPLLMAKAPQSWLEEMLSLWFEWTPGDGRDSSGEASKESLYNALLKANLGGAAKKFKSL